MSVTLQDDGAPFNMSLSPSVIAVNSKQDTSSVIGSIKKAKAAAHVDAKNGQPPIKVPFDQGPRSAAPITYKEPKKTVPTPAEKFVVDEQMQAVKAALAKQVVEPKKPAPTLPLSLNKLRMAHQKLVTPSEPAKAEPTRVFLKDLKVRPLPKEPFEALPLTGDAASQVFYLTEFIPELSDYLEMIEKAISKVISTMKIKSYKPGKDEVVLAFYEDRFYRAVCRASSLVDGVRNYSVLFIDYGDVAQVTAEWVWMEYFEKYLFIIIDFSNIRPFEDKALMFEIVTHSCKILNMPNNEADLVKLIESGHFKLKDAKESESGEALYTANFVL